jgi:very-short-patch-repair endonuclease
MRRTSRLPTRLGPEFSVREAREAGVSRSRLRASDLRRSFRGARSTARATAPSNESSARSFARQREELLQRCRDYLPVAPSRFRFSGVTAAMVYGVPLPRALSRIETLEVAVAAGSQRPRRRGIVGRRLAVVPPPVVRDGLPLLPPEQVWLQLAGVLTLDELIVAGDYLVRRKRAETSVERLVAEVAISKGSHGTKRARLALRDIRAGTDSPKETELRLLIVRAGLPEPVVGHRITDADGYFVGVPDLAYVEERIAIDYDGEVHRLDESVFLDDIERRERFEDAGWRYVRAAKNHLRSPGTLLGRIAHYLRVRSRAS